MGYSSVIRLLRVTMLLILILLLSTVAPSSGAVAAAKTQSSVFSNFLRLVRGWMTPKFRSATAGARNDDNPENPVGFLSVGFPGRKEILRQCFGRYGCFSIDYPWYSSHRVVNLFPESPREIQPHFFLYTRENPKDLHLLKDGDVRLVKLSRFDPNKMTFLLAHGYFEHGHVAWLQKMKNELLIHGDYNVIILDWLTGSGPPYTQATANIRLVGVMAGLFLKFLRDAAGLDLYHTHMIGHSLGAHLAGYTGNYLKKKENLELGRITGLDPAEPHFEGTHPEVKLDASDAYFVDVIHTDANPIMQMGLGLYESCGHIDFYPNGGKVMSGCDGSIMNSLEEEKGNMAYAFRRLVGCNHFRAYEYFTESINTKCPFIGVECPSWRDFASGVCNGCTSDGDPYGCEYMGFYAFAKLNGSRPTKKHRSMYLLTEKKWPFCAHHYRVTIVLSDIPESLKQGGDRGNFHMILNGDEDSSTMLQLNAEEAFFEPGRFYFFMTITHRLGHVKSADLVWEYSEHPINPLTWRIFTKSRMFVNRIEIEQFGHKHKHTFCAQDKPFDPGVPQNVVWKPKCRDNGPDPGATLLGTVLNADPIGNAEFLLDQVNPLTMNPLNGLANIRDAFMGLSETMTSMGPTMRRMGSEVARSGLLTSLFGGWFGRNEDVGNEILD